VIDTFCRSLLGVLTGMLRGWLRTSKMIGRCTQGIMGCVPSPRTCHGGSSTTGMATTGMETTVSAPRRCGELGNG